VVSGVEVPKTPALQARSCMLAMFAGDSDPGKAFTVLSSMYLNFRCHLRGDAAVQAHEILTGAFFISRLQIFVTEKIFTVIH